MDSTTFSHSFFFLFSIIISHLSSLAVSRRGELDWLRVDNASSQDIFRGRAALLLHAAGDLQHR